MQKSFKNKNGSSFIGLLALLLLVNASCSNTKHLPDGRSLHNSTKIIIDDGGEKVKESRSMKTNLLSLSRPKPNSKALGLFQAKLWLHNETKDAKKGLGKWLNRKVGEPPVLLDSIALEENAKRLNAHLFEKGYFNNHVMFATKTKKRKTDVTYTVYPNKPYVLDSIFYPVDSNRRVVRKMREVIGKSSLRKDEIFDAGKLQEERARLTRHLRNNGYYEFYTRFLEFDLDSSQNRHSVKIYLKLQDRPDGKEHRTYIINDVYIYPQNVPGSKAPYLVEDTVVHDGYYVVGPKKKRFKPKALTEYLLIKKGDLYSQRKHDHAINHLLELGVFKYVTIRYEQADAAKPWLLNCKLYLTPGKRMTLSAEAEINSRTGSAIGTGLLGTALTLGYKNKNIFKRAESLNLNVYSGIEFDLKRNDDAPLINTLDLKGELSLIFPRFILPFKIKRTSRYYRPYTTAAISTEYIRRVQLYTLNNTGFSWGYNWHETTRKRHILNPVAVTLLSLLSTSPSFDEQLQQDPRLRKSFEEQIIFGGNYNYIYSTQETQTKLKNYFIFRGGIGIAGNLMSALDKTLQATGATDGSLTVFKNPYSQYARFEGDFRHYHILGKKHSLVSRFYGGVGIAYGNSDVLPFVKQFAVGGSNSIRAFKIRGVGPGFFSTQNDGATDISDIDRTGDIRLEANIEYRFDISNFIKGALFTDIGNVWTLRSDEFTGKTGGSFNKNFHKGIAIGTGFGARLDFSYFVIRLDLATPIRDPRETEGNRWVITKMQPFKKAWRREYLNFNLAIGYPF